MSQSAMNVHVRNVIRYCEGFRIHKAGAQALGQKCLELSEEYQGASGLHGSFRETQVMDALSRAVSCTKKWSKKCICCQWISRHKMAQDIALVFNEICNTLQLLRALSPSHPLVKQTCNATLPPTTPVQRSIPLPSLSQHSLSISISTSFTRSSPHPSRSSTLSSTASEHPSSVQIPSPLSLSALSFPSLPDFNPSYPPLLISAQLVPAARPSQPLSPIPSSAVCESHPLQDHVTASHACPDASIRSPEQHREGEDTNELTSGGRSRRLPPGYFSDGNYGSLLSSPQLLQAEPYTHERSAARSPNLAASSEIIEDQRPKLRIKIPA